VERIETLTRSICERFADTVLMLLTALGIAHGRSITGNVASDKTADQSAALHFDSVADIAPICERSQMRRVLTLVETDSTLALLMSVVDVSGQLFRRRWRVHLLRPFERRWPACNPSFLPPLQFHDYLIAALGRHGQQQFQGFVSH
jgi:hypothetical protein